MKICLITNNYLLSMALRVSVRANECERDCIIIVIGENLLFYLTRSLARSLEPHSICISLLPLSLT